MRHWPRGQQIHKGKYIIEAILGGRGFAITYRAQNRKEGKLVAIKTLNANVQGKPNFREFQAKFVNKALSLARCSHPHVVQVYEVSCCASNLTVNFSTILVGRAGEPVSVFNLDA